MDSRTFSVQQVYQDRRQYRVPFYQRPYVWNREDQWGRLWEDIRDKADSRLSGGKAVPHFMGAVVLEPQKKPGLLGVERFHIIDGQQRLTTLQYVLTAVCHVLRELGQTRLLPLIEGCLVNPNPETMEDREIEYFKLWPTFRDRKQYVDAMTAATMQDWRERFPESFTKAGWLKKVGVDHPPALDAIYFFRESMLEWVNDTSESDAAARTLALASAVLTDLSIVCISLGEEDDAQVIFETLNGHGAELHATDLIRNFIFMRAGSDADQLYSSLWSQYESALWSESQSRGRLNRPRLEWFVQTAVQAETGDDIDIGRLYAGYRRCVDSQASLFGAKAQLEFLNRFADPYKALATGAGLSPIAVFGRRVAAWDASPTHSLSLRIATSGLDDTEQQTLFDMIESYLVRRAVCGLTRKNYNKVFAQLLKKLMDGGGDVRTLQALLAEPAGDGSRWPRDEEFRRHWLDGAIYPGRLDAAKLRGMFHRLETVMRSERTEERVPLSLDALDIDHILPQSWYAHWGIADGLKVSEEQAREAVLLDLAGQSLEPSAAAAAKRERYVSRIGNLTMVHYGVNRSLQNHAFAAKQKAFFEHSHLQLNRALTAVQTWDEDAIQARGEKLFEFALNLWRGPA
ncbi:DUF262 domain-containing HNH endonuclease family protein [Accumulibacter sp.]|uniref:DUF262 domain-containing protein n=1 Tax=Accumulibacter sp. TaxID=2053492 RepID=UPI0025E010CC|nr:DUF262 domain-containing HNH endonuclease family protein [Accumulibacter sp.]MCM8612055.1 DUF262 domain-containing HNH endonuclease family protein [Accumulibacter sp.]MCM8635721.1 DUF262 domain-containing HNH endonuclease family protein [Accumulibacter sp.]MCM8641661.1 DUF262 domain-containing HNH endonuclease family protein [Accumulibacter sp.]